MSLSFKVGGVIGGPLDGSVLNQLEQRKNIVSKKTTRTSDDIIYLNSNTGWVRITSAVDIPGDGGSELAKKYTLFNGTAGATQGFLPDSENSSYIESSTYGFTPIPGINNFNVKSRGTYGTLRDITFSFSVHSPEQFSILEQLYLRPGFTILVEWGHSIIVDDQGNITTNVKYFDKEKFLSPLSGETIQNTINTLKKENYNNYDALYGFIKNFSWTYNGYSYDCLVEVISKGEIISSIRGTFANNQEAKDDSDNSKYNALYGSSGLIKVLNTILTVESEKFFFEEPGTIPPPADVTLTAINFAAPYYTDAISDLKLAVGSLDGGASNWTKYISLRNFLELVNRGSLLKDGDDNNLVSFYTGTEKPTPFTTFPQHIGLDPYICILPKKSESEGFIFPFSKQVTDVETDETLNILVSVQFLIDTINSFRNKKDTLDNTIYNIVESVVKEIGVNLGDINEFGINYEEEENLYYIVDRKVIPSENDFTRGENNKPYSYIDLVGLKSEVENLNITSKLSEKITTMIAIAAQASANPSAANATLNIQKWNLGLVDRHLPVKSTGIDQKPQPVDSEEVIITEAKKEKYLSFLDRISTADNNFYISYDKNVINGYKEIHTQLMGEYLEKITRERNLNSPGLIPFELSFTMKGISGIKIGQAFKINEFFLPERYRGRVGFIVTGLDHQVSNNRWTTSVKTQITVL